MDKLIEAINISGSTIIIMSKTYVLETLKLFKLTYENKKKVFNTLEHMTNFIESCLTEECRLLEKIIFSSSTEL
jgi:hypothetical protein